jgi:hypothetical protein
MLTIILRENSSCEDKTALEYVGHRSVRARPLVAANYCGRKKPMASRFLLALAVCWRARVWSIEHMIQPTFQPGASGLFLASFFILLGEKNWGERDRREFSWYRIYRVPNCLNCSVRIIRTHLQELFRASSSCPSWSDPRGTVWAERLVACRLNRWIELVTNAGLCLDHNSGRSFFGRVVQTEPAFLYRMTRAGKW